MGLKFERVDNLDKLFESFAVDPKKKEMPIEELEKKGTKPLEDKDEKKEEK